MLELLTASDKQYLSTLFPTQGSQANPSLNPKCGGKADLGLAFRTETIVSTQLIQQQKKCGRGKKLAEREEKVCSLLFRSVIGGSCASSPLKFPSGGAALHNVSSRTQGETALFCTGISTNVNSSS